MSLFLEKIKPPFSLTVGIAAYNEATSIKKAIHSIAIQLSPTAEIIVVASGCTDGTEEVIKNINDPRLRLIRQAKRAGKAAAQNIIFTKARHEIIVFCDADVIVGQNALSYLTKHFQNEHVAAVSAYESGLQRKSFFDKVQAVGYRGLHEQKLKENAQSKFWSLNGHLFAVRRVYAPRLDPTNLVEDAWLGFQLKRKGYQLVYEPRARVYLKPAQNFKDYLKQKVRIRTGWWQMRAQGMRLGQKRSWSQLARFLVSDIYTGPFVFLEAICWLKAYQRFKQQKLVWEKVDSAKI